MTPQEATFYLWVLFTVECLILVFFIVYMRKHKYIYQISLWKDNVMQQMSKRCRYVKKKDGREYLVGIIDIFGRKKIPLSPNWRSYLMTAEGVPVVGIRHKLKVFFDGKQTYYWTFSKKIPGEHINKEEILHFAHESISELWERTKYQETQMEILKQIVFRSSIIVLALACLIFFPRILDSIMENGLRVYGSAIDKWNDVVTSFVPKG
jgi:hypothetical protein